jgi:capsular polysaccharide biosynthesis protein
MTHETVEFNPSNNSHAPDTGKVYGRARVPAEKSSVVAPPAEPASVDPTSSRVVPVSDDPSPATMAAPTYEPAPAPVGPVYRDEESVPAQPAAAPISEVSSRPGRWSVPKMIALTLVIVAVFTGAAIGYSLLQPTVYGAEAAIMLTPRPELSDLSVDRALLTQSIVIKSPSVLQPVSSRTGIPVSRLERSVSANVVGRSTVLRVIVTDRSRTRAVTVAELVSVQYSQAALPATPDNPAPVRPTIVTPAHLLSHPVQPQPWRAAAGGALVGLLVSVAVVVGLRRPWRQTRRFPNWE